MAGFEPDLVVLAGFMKLVCEDFLARFTHRQHPPGAVPVLPRDARPAEALAYGVKVTGATLFIVDGGVDTGPIIAQTVVPVMDDDSVETLHERIKTRRAHHAGRHRRADGPRRVGAGRPSGATRLIGPSGRLG